MKFDEITKLNSEELKSKETELSKELFNLKFQLHTGRLENTSRIKSLKKNIAQVKTQMNAIKG